MKKRIFLTALLAIAVTVTNAQLTDWYNLTNKDFVSCIAHDDNYLYVGTIGGGVVKIDKRTGEQTVLCRANGKMTDNSIQDIAVHNDELWVGTRYYGLAKITDGKIEKFDKRNAGFLTNQYISSIYFGDDGEMLVGGFATLYQFDGKQVTASFVINPLSPMTLVESIKRDSEGRIWVGCYDAQNRVTLSIFTADGLVPVKHSYGNVNQLEIGADGYLWMASDAGLVKYDGSDFTAYTPANSDLPEYSLHDLMADDKGNLWMVSNNYLTKYDGSHFVSYSYLSHSDADILTSIDIDGSDVYVGSRCQGLFRLTDKGLENIPLIDNRLADNSFTLSSGCLDRNGTFYGTTINGLQTYNIETDEAHLTPMAQAAQTEADRNGNIWVRWHWFSPDTCLMEITPTKTNVYYKSDYPFNEINMNQIKFDRQNRLWLATDKGIYCRNGQMWTVYNKNNSNLSSNNVTCLAFDSNDRIWCGTYGGGLFLFDGSSWTQYTTANSPLPSDYIGYVAVDNDNVAWLNCRDPQYPDVYDWEYGFGLTSFDGTNWKTYSRTNSPILSNCLYDIKIDADNNKWLATAGDVGLVCFDGTDWDIYNVDNSGIAINEVTQITIDAKRDLIWLTHYTGCGLSVAYMNGENSTIRPIVNPDSTIAETIYDLSGRQVVAPTKGFYIRQGKKYVK